MLEHKSGACFFQPCDEQDVTLHPKTNMDTQNGGLKKMAPFENMTIFWYLVSTSKISGGYIICRVL